MSSLNTHLKETLRLTNSLCIKLSDIARAMNIGLSLQGYKISSDKKTWKYYLNLAGIKHESNNDVKITIIENGEVRSLTKSLLEEFPYTKTELTKKDVFFKTLLNTYPEDEVYIKGCVYPVDLDEAINASDGTILNYEKSLVEKSELSLIPELERHIKDFINRWHNKEYSLIDELYTASFLAILYASIPSKIINIRLDKTHTNEAHSFHLENYFNSNLGLWKNMSIFKEETKYWLYKNLPYMLKHIGKNKTLQNIVNKVFNSNSIGIASYTIIRPDPNLNKNPYDTSDSAFRNKDVVLKVQAMNDAYEVDSNATMALEAIITDEINTIVTYIDRSLTDEFIIDETKREILNIHNNKSNVERTKIIDIRINRFFKNYGLDLFKIIFDYWSYIISKFDGKYIENYVDANNNETGSKNLTNKRINKLVDFIDPNNNQIYRINPYQGFLFALKILLKLTNRLDAKLVRYNYDIVLDNDPMNLYKIYKKMYIDGYTDILLEDLIQHYPKIDTWVFNNESFHNYIEDVLNYYTYIWTLDSNSESCIVSSNIKQLFYYNMQRGYLKLTDDKDPIDGLTIDELLVKENLTYDIPSTFDLILSLNGLVKTFTGYNIDEYYTKDEIVYNAKEFLSKLTAYTTQILTTSDETRSIFLYYNNVNPFRTNNPIIGDIKAKLCPYEHNHLHLKTQGWNVADNPILITENIDWKQSAFERLPAFTGIGAFDNVPEVKFTRNDPPRTTVEVKDQFVFDASKSDRISPIELDLNLSAPDVE